MRKIIYLENKYGNKLYFKYSTGVLISDIKGLGFLISNKYLKYGHKFKKIKDDFTIDEITATLSFIEGYAGYDNFIKYINNDLEGLKLYVESHDLKYVYIDIIKLTKGEIKNGFLTSEIYLNKKSLWIKERSIILNLGSMDDGKTYPIKYPFSYTNVSFGRTKVLIDGIKEASTVLEIEGKVINPEIKVFKDDTLISEMKLNINKENAKLYISSIPDELKMINKEEDLEVDIYNLQDFSKDNFIKLPRGDLTIDFNSGTEELVYCKLTIYEYHLG